jgi:translation elongation factor EF-1beta
MIDLNEIENNIEEINNEKSSLHSKRKTSLLFGLVNCGLSFTPIGLYTVPV